MAMNNQKVILVTCDRCKRQVAEDTEEGKAYVEVYASAPLDTHLSAYIDLCGDCFNKLKQFIHGESYTRYQETCTVSTDMDESLENGNYCSGCGRKVDWK